MSQALRTLALLSLCALSQPLGAVQAQAPAEAVPQEPQGPPPGFQFPEVWEPGLLIVVADRDGSLGGRSPVLAVEAEQTFRIPLADDGEPPDTVAGDGVHIGLAQVPPVQQANFVLFDADGARLWTDQAPLSEAETRPRIGFHVGSFGVLAALRTMNDPLGEPLARGEDLEQVFLEALTQRQPLPPYLADLLTCLAALGLLGGFCASWFLGRRLNRPPVTVPLSAPGGSERS